jgi:hypothetical protein
MMVQRKLIKVALKGILSSLQHFRLSIIAGSKVLFMGK